MLEFFTPRFYDTHAKFPSTRNSPKSCHMAERSFPTSRHSWVAKIKVFPPISMILRFRFSGLRSLLPRVLVTSPYPCLLTASWWSFRSFAAKCLPRLYLQLGIIMLWQIYKINRHTERAYAKEQLWPGPDSVCQGVLTVLAPFWLFSSPLSLPRQTETSKVVFRETVQLSDTFVVSCFWLNRICFWIFFFFSH